MNSLEIQTKINSLSNALSRLEGEKNALEKIRNEQEACIEALGDKIEKSVNTSQFLQKIANIRHSAIKERLEKSTTIALRNIFENDDLTFKINNEEKRSVISSSFKISKEKLGIELDPKYAFGGSLLDVISTVMRILFNELNMPKTEGPIILDEVGKFIDSEYQKNFIIFMRQISEDLDRQIIFVTHFQTFAKTAHKLLRVVQENGESTAYDEIVEEG